MTAALGVVALALGLGLGGVLIEQRRHARRLVAAGRRLSDDVVLTGSGLAEAASLIERVVDRTLSRGVDVSLAEARLASALSVMPQGIAVFDADGGLAFRNRVAAGHLSARHSEALVDEAIEQIAVEVLANGGAPVQRTIDLFGPPRRTLTLKGVGIERREVDLGVLVIIDDITDRRRLEAIRRDFVANISHELKTPVGAIGLLAETLVAEDDPKVARRLAERMLHEAFRVARTIDDLLELSRIEADLEMLQDALSVASLITEAHDRVRSGEERHNIVVDEGPVPPQLSVVGDRRQLVSAIYNLLDNALKYSHPGSSVKVDAHREGPWIEVNVTDHGIGIPRRDLERVFERFYRVDRARSRETGGTGLGLAIVRHIAVNHGGEVHVDSREGEGSTFTLRLPAVHSAPDMASNDDSETSP